MSCFFPKEHSLQVNCATCQSQKSPRNITVAFENEGPVLSLLSKVSRRDPLEIITTLASYMSVQFLKKESVIPDVVCFAPQSPVEKNFLLERFAKQIARVLSTSYQKLFYTFDEPTFRIKINKSYGHQKTVLIIDQCPSNTKGKQLYQMLKGAGFKRVFELYVLDRKC